MFYQFRNRWNASLKCLILNKDQCKRSFLQMPFVCSTRLKCLTHGKAIANRHKEAHQEVPELRTKCTGESAYRLIIKPSRVLAMDNIRVISHYEVMQIITEQALLRRAHLKTYSSSYLFLQSYILQTLNGKPNKAKERNPWGHPKA